MIRNQKRRIHEIEERLGMDRNDEIVEFPWPDGRIVLTTRRALDESLNWLEGRENNGQEAIETN